jgi:hypothetical protein
MFIEPILAATPGARPEQVYEEAAVVAMKLFQTALDERRNVLWVSGDLPLDGLQYLADKLRGQPYVGVFRNEAPADGSTVQMFQAGGRTEPLVG